EKNSPDLANTYSDFEVMDSYKGVTGKSVRVYYGTYPTGGPFDETPVYPFQAGSEQVIYAVFKNGFLITGRGMCSACYGPEELESIKAQYDAVEELIKSSPRTQEFYLKKISLYEENKDYTAAVATFERLFAANPETEKSHEYEARYGS